MSQCGGGHPAHPALKWWTRSTLDIGICSNSSQCLKASFWQERAISLRPKWAGEEVKMSE